MGKHKHNCKDCAVCTRRMLQRMSRDAPAVKTQQRWRKHHAVAQLTPHHEPATLLQPLLLLLLTAEMQDSRGAGCRFQPLQALLLLLLLLLLLHRLPALSKTT